MWPDCSSAHPGPRCHWVACGPTQAGRPRRPVPCLAKVSGLPYSDLS